ncbi:MAG: hypothetical protein ABL986_03935 [Vicinamibacterales bacterium]
MWSLVRRYWNDLVSTEGGFALLWIDGLLFIPLAMAAFFFPLQVAELVGGIALATIVGYEGWVLWRKKHPRGTHA